MLTDDENMQDSSAPNENGASAPAGDVSLSKNRWILFLVGFLVLFIELACIRWFGAYVVFLQFFTNLVLIACFLGMSIGCVCASSKTDWLRRFPGLTLLSMSLGGGLTLLYNRWSGIAIDVGGQESSPQMVFFGTEARNVDLAEFVLPVELIAGVIFVLVTLMFVGLGQVLGRSFDRDPDRVRAYTANIAGSLAGILGFAALSFSHAPPIAWFGIGFLGIIYLLRENGALTRAQLILLGLCALLVLLAGMSLRSKYEFRWSPYYWILYAKEKHGIITNNIGHQRMHAIDTADVQASGAVYSLIHLLRRDAGMPPAADSLIIGAGSGNDVAHALYHDVGHVDAVEIDPVIHQLGVEHHPEQPYSDSRVSVHLNDGRNFLRRTESTYDLISYALVDSLILHSSHSDIRLESFLFTEQAFRDAKAVLADDGIFVTYNYFRQGWIVQRIVRMLEEVFGQEPIIISLATEEVEEIRADDEGRLQQITMLICGNTGPIRDAFSKSGSFWLNRNVTLNKEINGYSEEVPAIAGGRWDRIHPTDLVPSAEPLRVATDNWPFLYLREPTVPWLYLRGALLLTIIGIAILYWLSPGHKLSLNPRMFFLGAGFMLLETKAIVHLSLIFGSTWVVNSMVFTVILIMILGANLYVMKVKRIRIAWHYALLFITLGVNAFVPLNVFLAGNFAWTYIAPSVMAMCPVFFAGVIFAVSFRESRTPDRDFGANIAGAVVGGFSEYFSMLLGFRYLLFVAMAYYLLSIIRGRR